MTILLENQKRNSRSLHCASLRSGWQIRLEVDDFARKIDKGTDSQDDDSVGEPEEKQQVPPLRFAPVGMTNSLKGR